MGYEIIVFRLTEQDAQILDYRNPAGTIRSRFTLVRDEEGQAQTQAYDTEQDLELFISVTEDAIADHEAEAEYPAAAPAQLQAPKPGQQAQML